MRLSSTSSLSHTFTRGERLDNFYYFGTPGQLIRRALFDSS